VYGRGMGRTHAVLYGPVRLVPGVSGAAIRLAGPDETVEVPAHPGLDVTDRFTLAWWMKPHATARAYRLFAKDRFTRGWDLYGGRSSKGKVSLNLRVGGFKTPDHVGAFAAQPGAWVHVAFTYDGRLKAKSLCLYINGRRVNTWDEAGRVGVNNKPLVVAGPSVLDNVRLYRDSLSPTAVRSLYEADPKAMPGKSAVVERVWPLRLRYDPGQTVTVDVRLASRVRTPTPVRVRVYGVTDVAAEHPLQTADVTLLPDKPHALTVAWKPAGEPYGCEVVAELTDPATGKVLDRKGEVVLVARNAYRAGHKAGLSLRSWDPAHMKQIARDVFGWRRNYIPLTELMSVGLDNFSKWVPDTDRWFSGQGSTAYRNSKDLVLGLVNQCHAHGIAVVPYINTGVSGVYGTEFARQHPEWMVYDVRGHYTGGVETRQLERLRTFYDRYPASVEDKDAMARLVKPDRGGGLQISAVNCACEEAVRFSVEQVAKGVRLFGFDGLRFDGHYQVAAPSDPAAIGVARQYDYKGDPPVPDQAASDRLSARNTRMMKKRLWREFPGFVFGYNWGHPYAKYGCRRPQDYAECARDGGMILWESINHHYGPTSPWHRWREAADAIADEVEQPARHGGTLNVGWFHWWLASDIYGRHLFAIICAARAHLSGAGSPRIPHAYYRFSARYAGLLFKPDVKRDPPTGAGITVSPKHLWWRRYVYQRRKADGSTQLIVHLLNPPAQETTDIATRNAPKPVRDVSIGIEARRGQQWRSVHWLSPDDSPVCRRLPAQTDGGKGLRIQVPALKYWGVLVIDF